MTAFARYIGIDYSGAETPTSSLKGLRVCEARPDAAPCEILPPPSPKKYWTRKGIAHWLVDELSGDLPTLVGIDHGFSFPLRYFETHGLMPDWSAFLDDFQRHWPTDGDNTYVDFVRDGIVGNGAARTGNTRWRRLTEERAGGAKNPSSISMSRVRSPNPPMPVSPGCGSSASSLVPTSISGPSTAGRCRKDARSLPRSIRPCGIARFHAKTGRRINTTPIPSSPGWLVLTAMAISPATSHQT